MRKQVTQNYKPCLLSPVVEQAVLPPLEAANKSLKLLYQCITSYFFRTWCPYLNFLRIIIADFLFTVYRRHVEVPNM